MASFVFRLVRVAVVLALAAGIGFYLFATRKKPEKQEVVTAPPGVRVMVVQPESKSMVVEAFGTVVPRHKVNVAAEVAGRIDGMHPEFRAGGLIQKGQVMIQIDERTFKLDKAAAQARVRQARADIAYLTRDIENLKADVELARSNMELSRKEMERLQALSLQQFASKTSLDKAEQQFLAARIQVQSAQNRLALATPQMAQKEAALVLAKNDVEKAALILEKSQILAPFTGFVLSRQVEYGEYVNPGQILGVVYQKGALDVDVSILLEQLEWLQPVFADGKMPGAEVEIANLKIDPAVTWPARVVRIQADIDEKTRTLPMTLEVLPRENKAIGDQVPNHPGNPLAEIKPGAFVRCRITGKLQDGIYVLPRYLIQADGRVFVAKNNQLDIRTVEILRKFEDQVFITSGLQPGDQVISSPLPGALEDMRIRVKSSETPKTPKMTETAKGHAPPKAAENSGAMP